jgi:hypothetical protein
MTGLASEKFELTAKSLKRNRLFLQDALPKRSSSFRPFPIFLL